METVLDLSEEMKVDLSKNMELSDENLTLVQTSGSPLDFQTVKDLKTQSQGSSQWGKDYLVHTEFVATLLAYGFSLSPSLELSYKLSDFDAGMFPRYE